MYTPSWILLGLEVDVLIHKTGQLGFLVAFLFFFIVLNRSSLNNLFCHTSITHVTCQLAKQCWYFWVSFTRSQYYLSRLLLFPRSS